MFFSTRSTRLPSSGRGSESQRPAKSRPVPIAERQRNPRDGLSPAGIVASAGDGLIATETRPDVRWPLACLVSWRQVASGASGTRRLLSSFRNSEPPLAACAFWPVYADWNGRDKVGTQSRMRPRGALHDLAVGRRQAPSQAIVLDPRDFQQAASARLCRLARQSNTAAGKTEGGEPVLGQMPLNEHASFLIGRRQQVRSSGTARSRGNCPRMPLTAPSSCAWW